MNSIYAIAWSDISGAEIAAAIVFAWSVVTLCACVMAGHFKDHPSTRANDDEHDRAD